MASLNRITPCLWFDTQAEEAARFYTSLFEDSRVLKTTYYGPGMPGPEGSVLTVEFELAGQRVVALNGGPHFTFDEAFSLVVDCADQQEVDRLWEALTEGGQESQCGWLKDRYGLSWQIIPTVLNELLEDPDPGRRERATAAMLRMGRIDVAELLRAADGG
ncbi:VOC family protein [Nocardiopsis sp. NPDC049922]|uniref:VOC family protein n=1 Tax=Nocardiopsis sp. NPDC049922 TaxID=3155157 RepID=UPI0033D78937